MQVPNFSGLIYGVTRSTQGNMDWLSESLYHRPLTAEELAKENLLAQVGESTPPAFLVHAYDDTVCDVEETTDYVSKLLIAGVEHEVHLFPKGEHGFGAGRTEDGTDQWLGLFANWVKRL